MWKADLFWSSVAATLLLLLSCKSFFFSLQLRILSVQLKMKITSTSSSVKQLSNTSIVERYEGNPYSTFYRNIFCNGIWTAAMASILVLLHTDRLHTAKVVMGKPCACSSSKCLPFHTRNWRLLLRKLLQLQYFNNVYLMLLLVCIKLAMERRGIWKWRINSKMKDIKGNKI